MANNAPWWADLTEDEREQEYSWACEGWSERYAEAGSGHVFSGGSSCDASLVASEVAGPYPKREEFGLAPEEPVAPSKPSWVPDEDDIPF